LSSDDTELFDAVVHEIDRAENFGMGDLNYMLSGIPDASLPVNRLDEYLALLDKYTDGFGDLQQAGNDQLVWLLANSFEPGWQAHLSRLVGETTDPERRRGLMALLAAAGRRVGTDAPMHGSGGIPVPRMVSEPVELSPPEAAAPPSRPTRPPSRPMRGPRPDEPDHATAASEPPPQASPGDDPPDEAPDTDAPDDRRLGVSVGTEEPAVGAPIDIVVSIAPPGTAQAQVNESADIGFAPGVTSRNLPVYLVARGQQFDAVMTLPANPTESGTVTFTLTPPSPMVHGTIAIYNESHTAILQAAEFFVMLDGGAPTPQIHLVDAASLAGLVKPNTASLVATSDQFLFGQAGDVPVPASSSGVVNQIAAVTAGLVNAGKIRINTGHSPDGTILKAAQIGADLHTAFRLDPLNSVDHIQMVSFDTQTVFPVDLIYGGPRPDDTATMCQSWANDATATACPTCTDLDAEQAKLVVCPLSFWGLGKVIEHHWPDQATTTTAVARVHRGSDTAAASALDTILAGASQIVTTNTGSATVTEALAPLTSATGAAMSIAEDWDGWEAIVESESPTLLVALPHNARITEHSIEQAALEIGGDASVLDESLIRSAQAVPGPIVVLLGCNTATESAQLLSFAAICRSYAPVVVATIGEVIAKEAPLVAKTVVSELESAATDGRTVGQAIRDARRKMLAEGRTVGLQLVLHGDSEWRIDPRETT
jgi:hypothetical protein